MVSTSQQAISNILFPPFHSFHVRLFLSKLRNRQIPIRSSRVPLWWSMTVTHHFEGEDHFKVVDCEARWVQFLLSPSEGVFDLFDSEFVVFDQVNANVRRVLSYDRNEK